ncbi:kinase-like domain-containing protein [Pelagophyceae sp. CCMP2097]|nr:kinase-like domain-containing protein [Pelagophyceae sp. CCMP2097]
MAMGPRATASPRTATPRGPPPPRAPSPRPSPVLQPLASPRAPPPLAMPPTASPRGALRAPPSPLLSPIPRAPPSPVLISPGPRTSPSLSRPPLSPVSLSPLAPQSPGVGWAPAVAWTPAQPPPVPRAPSPGAPPAPTPPPSPVPWMPASPVLSEDGRRLRSKSLDISAPGLLQGDEPRRKRRSSVLRPDALGDVYELSAKIGRGAFGTVARCTHLESKLVYAVKTVRRCAAAAGGAEALKLSHSRGALRDLAESEFLKEGDIDAALAAEIEILTNMHHPHIIELIDVFDDAAGDAVHIVMPLCQGGELFDRLANGFSEVDAAVLTQQMLSAIEYLHSQHIVHRDLKPENFMFMSTDDDSDLVLIDFGISTFFHNGKPLDTALGTVFYTAPEVFDGAYDERCDVWSIGIICFMLLVGHAPFEDAKGREYRIVHQIQTKAPKFDAKEWAGVSKSAVDFVTSLLQKDPALRPSARSAASDVWFAVENVSALAAYGCDMLSRLGQFKQMNAMKKVAHQIIATELTEAEIGHLQQQFRLLDADGDGVITANELLLAVQTLDLLKDQVPMVQVLVDSLKSRGDATLNVDLDIDIDEFIAATFSHNSMLKHDNLKNAYDTFDVTGGGGISLGDLEHIFGSKRHAQEVFDVVDTNGDGKISFDEFRDMMGLSPEGTMHDSPASQAHEPVFGEKAQGATSAHSRIKRFARAHSGHSGRDAHLLGLATAASDTDFLATASSDTDFAQLAIDARPADAATRRWSAGDAPSETPDARDAAPPPAATTPPDGRNAARATPPPSPN